MTKVYLELIQAGLRTLDQVPATWRESVRLLLSKVAQERLAEGEGQ